MGSTGFTSAVASALRNYTNFRGLATRAQYWWFVLFQVIGSIIFTTTHLQPLGALWTLGLLIPSLSCGVRRHHDAGRSGWWLLTSIIPVWGLVLLLYPSKLVNNRFHPGSGSLDDAVTTAFTTCARCGKMPLPGQAYCTGCGAPLNS